MAPIFTVLGFKGVVLGGLIFINVENLVIYEDTALNIYGNSHEHNHKKLEITKFMSILLFLSWTLG